MDLPCSPAEPGRQGWTAGQSGIPGVMPIGAVTPPVMAPIRMMVTPPPGMRPAPTMPRVSIPPAPRFRRLGEGGSSDRQGGERCQDEFPHPFTSSLLVAWLHNGKTCRITPINYKFLFERRVSCPTLQRECLPPRPADPAPASPRPSPRRRALRPPDRAARSRPLSRRAQ